MLNDVAAGAVPGALPGVVPGAVPGALPGALPGAVPPGVEPGVVPALGGGGPASQLGVVGAGPAQDPLDDLPVEEVIAGSGDGALPQARTAAAAQHCNDKIIMPCDSDDIIMVRSCAMGS